MKRCTDSRRCWVAVLFDSNAGNMEKSVNLSLEPRKKDVYDNKHRYSRCNFSCFVSTFSTSIRLLFLAVIALSAGLVSLQPHSLLSDLNRASAMFPSKSNAPDVSPHPHNLLQTLEIARTHRHRDGSREIQGDSCCTSTPSTFPQEMNTCDRCWKETAVLCPECRMRGEKLVFCLLLGGNLVLFSMLLLMLALHHFPALVPIYTLLLLHFHCACVSVWRWAKYEETDGKEEGRELTGCNLLKFLSLLFVHDKTEEEKFCQWW